MMINQFMLYGTVKTVDESAITLEAETGTFKINFIDALKEQVANIKVDDKVGFKGKLEASKGIKLVAEKIIAVKRGA